MNDEPSDDRHADHRDRKRAKKDSWRLRGGRFVYEIQKALVKRAERAKSDGRRRDG